MKIIGFIRIVWGLAFSSLLLFASPGLAQKKALALQQADQIYRQADSLFQQAQDSLATVKYQQAIAIYLQHNHFGPNLADAFLGLGIIHESGERFYRALSAYQTSIRYLKKFRPQVDSTYFYPFLQIASCYMHLNKYDSAAVFLAKAQPLLARYPGIIYSQRFYNQMGVFFEASGNFTQSINYIEKAVKTLRFDPGAPSHDRYTMIRYVLYNTNIARSLSRLGHYRQAIVRMKGLIRFRHLPHILYMNIASAYLQMNQPDSALFYLRKVPLEGPDISNPIFTRINYYNTLGLVYQQKAQWKQAQASYAKARQINLQHFRPKNLRLGRTYAGQGQVYCLQALYEKGLKSYQSALQALHFNFSAADIYQNPTDLANVVSALSLFEVLTYKADAFREYHGQTGKLKDLQAALDTYQLAFRLSDLIRKGYDSDEVKLFFTNTVAPAYEEAIATAFQLFKATRQRHYLEAAFALAEQSKAAVLAESLRGLKIRQIPGISPALLRQERNLKRDITALNLKLLEESQPDREESYRDQLREKEIKMVAVLREFEKNKQYYQLKYDNSPVQVSSIQGRLDAKTALVEYFVGKKNLFVFVLDASRFEARQINLTPVFLRDWEQLRQALYQPPSGPGRYQGDAPAYRLYRQLLAPVASYLAGKQRLIIVPDKELCYLPFEALVSRPHTPRYLLEDYTVSYAYSGKLLRDAAPDQRLGWRASILAMAPFAYNATRGSSGLRQALPDTDRLSPLYASAGEVEQIGGQVYLGPEATKQRLLEQMNQYDIIHLATHAKADIQNPLHSFIAFYPQPPVPGSYRLYVPEIYNLRLDKLKLVVLSACETGGGQLVQGEGIMSLARAFAYAGCPSTVTTLWKAEDQTSAYISSRLYAHLKAGKAKDVALRLAKLDYLQSQPNWRKRSPVYWANFIFIGDQTPVYSSYAFLWWLAAGLVLAGAGWIVYKKRREQSSRPKKERNTFSENLADQPML